MRWKEWISKPYAVLVFVIVGGPGTVDDVREWVELLGVNVLTTLALMGLAAHVTAVGFRAWEPYRSWIARLSSRRAANARAALQCNFDLEPGNGRIAARLILESSSLGDAQQVYSAFQHRDATSCAYGPPCALAAVLARHGELDRSRDLVEETSMRASFRATHEKTADATEFRISMNEFFPDAQTVING